MWFHTVFCECILQPIVFNPQNFEKISDDKRSLIIDSQSLHLDLIDFNPSVNVKELIGSARSNAEGRSKPLFAMVRGWGTGKTRALTEIMKEICLKYHKDVFVVAITCSGAWQVGDTYDIWPGVSSAYQSYALSVVSRMASMCFGVELSKVCALMREPLSGYVDLVRETKGNAKDYIRQFIIWITEWVKVKAKKFRKGIDTFVLLVDDAVAMEDYIGKKFGVWDSTLVVREALLGMSWFSTAIHVSLAISSLTIAPIGRHRSKRKIVSILLPDALSGDQIIELIWWKCVTEERAYLSQPPLVLTVTERNRLLFLAKMVSQIPRLVEMVNDFFRHRKFDTPGTE